MPDWLAILIGVGVVLAFVLAITLPWIFNRED